MQLNEDQAEYIKWAIEQAKAGDKRLAVALVKALAKPQSRDREAQAVEMEAEAQRRFNDLSEVERVVLVENIEKWTTDGSMPVAHKESKEVKENVNVS
jgi:hypothetical protein